VPKSSIEKMVSTHDKHVLIKDKFVGVDLLISVEIELAKLPNTFEIKIESNDGKKTFKARKQKQNLRDKKRRLQIYEFKDIIPFGCYSIYFKLGEQWSILYKDVNIKENDVRIKVKDVNDMEVEKSITISDDDLKKISFNVY